MTDGPLPFPAERSQGVQPRGLGYVYRNPTLGLTLHFSYLRGGSEPSAEVRAETVLPGVSGHLVTGRVKLTGPRSKGEFAKALWDAWEVQPLKVWADQVELACQDVLERMRAGAPIVEFEGAFEIPAERPARVELLVPDQATTVLYGAGGSGKGWIAIGLCVAVGLGVPFCGLQTQGGKVLYLDFEDDLTEFKRRLHRVAQGMAVVPRNIKYRECRQSFETMVEDLAGYVKAAGIALVVIDSAEAAMSDSDERTSSAARANRLFNQIRHVDATTLLIDHVTGEGLKSQQLAGRPFDSVFKAFRARATWEVKKDQETGSLDWQVGLYLTKQNRSAPLPPIGLRIDLTHPGECRFTREDVRSSDVLALATPWRYRIDGALLGRKLSYEAIYEALNAGEKKDQDAIRQALKRGVDQRRYGRGEEGGQPVFWRLAPDPDEIPEEDA